MHTNYEKVLFDFAYISSSNYQSIPTAVQLVMRKTLALFTLTLLLGQFGFGQCVPDKTLLATSTVAQVGGNTTAAADDCTLNALTREHTIRVTIPCQGDWVFETCGGNTNFDTWLFIGNACCDGSLGNDNNTCNAQDRVTLNGISAGDYYAEIEGWGQSVAGDYTLTVYEITPPTITCPANQSVNSAPGQCSAAATFVTPTATDNCSSNPSEQITSGMTSGSSFPVGVTTNVYTATDDAGNTATCSFTITVNDVENPTITCPQNMTVNMDSNSCTGTANYTAPVGADNCPGAITTIAQGYGPGSGFAPGVNTEIYLVTDSSGNTDTCSFKVTVVDQITPTITCPSNMIVANDPGQCIAVVNYTPPSAVDNCPNPTVSLASGLGSGANFPVGTTTEVWHATDGNLNIDSCSFTITVEDTEKPTILGCPTNQFVNATDSSDCNPVVTWAPPTPSDNCPGVLIVESDTSGSEFPIGSTPVTYIVTDASGNADTCAFNVIVQAMPFLGSGTIQQHETCQNASDGIACANPKGGCTPYTYSWSTGDTSKCASGLAAGSYIVTMVDGQGKSVSDTVTITTGTGINPVITQSGDTLCTGSGYATYQWLDGNGDPISGANQPCFIPGANGNFSVQVTDSNGCDGQSTAFTFVGMEDDLKFGLTIYPNPSTGTFWISPEQTLEGPVWIQVFDQRGRLAKSLALQRSISQDFPMRLSNYTAGIYYVRIQSASGSVNKKLILE